MGNGESKNGLSGLKDLNWPTVVLIVATGVGNWFNTNENAGLNRVEIERARQQINEIYESQKRLPALKEIEPVIQNNADHIMTLQDRIDHLEKRLDNGMEALQEIVNESKDAANKAADISEDTRTVVKNAPPPVNKHTTVVKKTQRIQRIQKVQKVYKLF